MAVLSACGPAAPAAAPPPELRAADILQAAGFRGGLIVHLGCGDGRLAAALGAGDGRIVHGLDTDADNVAKAREHVRSLGLYGKVSVERWTGGPLPYADNLVNLFVAEDLGAVPVDEVLRVLAPLGAAYAKDASGKWTKTVKPWPDDIDEWTHHLHGPGGNAVARDKVVGPPEHLQWTAGPLWARSHGWTPSVSAMVSAGGRLFFICDETLTGVDATVPDKWFLTARDAFSGVLLWKRPVPDWGSTRFSGTPDSGGGGTTGRFTMPPQVGKRLVAVGDAVYVTLGAAAPVTALDAATGKERRTYAETAHADEVLCSDGRLILSLNQPGEGAERSTRKQVCAVDARTGRVLWKKAPFAGVRATVKQDPFGRLELAAGDGQVFLMTEDSLESLELDSGKQVWRIDRPALREGAVQKIGFAGVFEYRLTVLVYQDGVVLLAQPEPEYPHTYHTMPGTLYAFEAKSGRLMWKHAYGAWGHCTPPDVFVVGEVVWVHEHAKAEFASAPAGGVRAQDPAAVDYAIQGLDLKTGEVRRRLPTKDVFNVGHHHRCYRNKITERFLMAARRGVEFVDLSSGENYLHHWVRSGCLLGNLPCNGLLYVAPHPCGCYIEAKLTGFLALAPRGERKPASRAGSEAEGPRLEKGPAYGQPVERGQSGPDPAASWPTYRHDGRRSGATEGAVAAELAPVWQASVGGRPSSVTVAEGRLLVAGVEAHTVHALDARDGKPLWRYTAGARVDSPPTLHDGLAVFGSADGRAFCLRASDGALVWRFRAAPQERRAIAFDQLESPWPIPGSPLIHEGKCWLAAGRSSYLDGGIHLYALDPATGEVAKRQTIYSPDPNTGKMPPGTSNTVPGLLNDIPATDGSSVFIRQMEVSSSGGPAGWHLYTTAGYLDPSWFNRTLWKVGNVATSGLAVLGKDVAYGVEIYPSRSRETVFRPGVNGYRLACYSLSQSALGPAGPGGKGRKAAPKGPKVIWEQQVPIRITAMVRAADVLFVAGPPDVVDPADPHGAWEGRKGGVLAAFSAADGKKLSERRLPAPPVWDGMAADDGRLYLSMQDGKVLCLGGVGSWGS